MIDHRFTEQFQQNYVCLCPGRSFPPTPALSISQPFPLSPSPNVKRQQEAPTSLSLLKISSC